MSMLDLYGIKEVADVVFWDIDTGAPVLYLDTLKVSTIEETAEQTEARGGKGNPPLIIWDYGKEITVTLEDALFSMKSMSVMHSQSVKVATDVSEVERIGKFTTDSTGAWSLPKSFPSDVASVKVWAADGSGIAANGSAVKASEAADINTAADLPSLAPLSTYLCRYVEDVAGEAETIEVSSENFPGTYRITGDTYARSQRNGKDEFFQFEIPQAKVSPEQTITMQAEGDPSTFSMTVRVMRPDDGVMMKLTKYPKAE